MKMVINVLARSRPLIKMVSLHCINSLPRVDSEFMGDGVPKAHLRILSMGTVWDTLVTLCLLAIFFGLR